MTKQASVETRGESMSRDKWSAEDVAKVISNPVYTGVGQYPRVIDDDTWVAANKRMVEEMGAEAYLRRLLAVLRETFSA
jgi:hypothetical protein